jgi:hypothetical protein
MLHFEQVSLYNLEGIKATQDSRQRRMGGTKLYKLARQAHLLLKAMLGTRVMRFHLKRLGV